MTEDEMVGWYHRLNGHGFGWTLGVGDRQGGLVCSSSWGHRESDTTECLNGTELIQFLEKGMTEDKMVGWHHRLSGYRFGWTLGVGDGQGGLMCCGSWGRKLSCQKGQAFLSSLSPRVCSNSCPLM